MRKLTIIVQTSLDGFVAGLNSEFDNFIGGEENLDWPTAASKPYATRNMIKYSNWYNAVSKFILSKTLKIEGAENTLCHFRKYRS